MTESLEIFNNQAINFASHGEYSEAIACFKKALQFEQGNYLLWFNLGVTYRDSGDLIASQEALERSLQLAEECGQTGEDVIEALSQMLFMSGDFEGAIQYCARGLEINIMNSRIWNTFGAVSFNLSAFDEAANAFENALTVDPFYYDALFNLRDTYEKLGNEAGRIACSERLKELGQKEF